MLFRAFAAMGAALAIALASPASGFALRSYWAAPFSETANSSSCSSANGAGASSG